jgi:hypothetical protein
VSGHLINLSSSKFQINSTMHLLKIFNGLPGRIFQDNALWLHILPKRFVHHITVSHGSSPSDLESSRRVTPSLSVSGELAITSSGGLFWSYCS